MNILKKLLLSIIPKISDTEYCNLYSSRKVLKNDDMNKNNNHFYDTDIWGLVNEKLKYFLQKGQTIYGEVVGYTPSCQMIQKNYDYKCLPGTFDFYIYRITSTNIDGKVVEWSMKMVQDWCKENGIKAVPQVYYGYAKDLFPELDVENHWNENFLEKLKEKYLEKDSVYCNNKVPEEGIVLRVEKNIIEPMKLKSLKFLEHETNLLDSGEVDIESDN